LDNTGFVPLTQKEYGIAWPREFVSPGNRAAAVGDDEKPIAFFPAGSGGDLQEEFAGVFAAGIFIGKNDDG
jgi:hypothetical protein